MLRTVEVSTRAPGLATRCAVTASAPHLAAHAAEAHEDAVAVVQPHQPAAAARVLVARRTHQQRGVHLGVFASDSPVAQHMPMVCLCHACVLLTHVPRPQVVHVPSVGGNGVAVWAREDLALVFDGLIWGLGVRAANVVCWHCRQLCMVHALPAVSVNAGHVYLCWVDPPSTCAMT